MSLTDTLSTLADGFAVLPGVVPTDTTERLTAAVGRPVPGSVAREKNDRIYAVRNLLAVPEVRELADSPPVRGLVEPVLGGAARPVRGLLFDKTAGANWKVAWHQDLSIAVKQRVEVPGFGPWSVKAGVQHVQPPRHVLDGMLTVRLHLDDCGEDNGPLKVLPGSHAAGPLPPAEVARWCGERAPVACVVAAGGAVLMRPLILHASSPARVPGHRRVIHLEFASGELPGGLEWAED